MFLVKGVLQICNKCTGEHPCQSVISIKLLCNLIEITLWHVCSPVNLLNISRTPFYKKTSGRKSHRAPFKSFYLGIKHGSLLNRVLGVLACSRALRVYVLACSRALRAYVLTRLACLRAYRAYVLSVLACLHTSVLGVLCVLGVFNCLRAWRAYVLTGLLCLRARVVITRKCFIFLRVCALDVWCAFLSYLLYISILKFKNS